MDLKAVETWIGGYVVPTGRLVTVRDRPWATVVRVPVRKSVVWFKACATEQRHEPQLTVDLFARWPALTPEVLGHDNQRGWLLLADAGSPVGKLGNPPELWLRVLPLYAELQRAEAERCAVHLARGVPDLRTTTLPDRYADLIELDLPIVPAEVDALRRLKPRFEELCSMLGAAGVPETIQHDDLHMGNLFSRNGHLRVMDWGDASIAHPFFSLVVTFRFLEEFNGRAPSDPWFTRLRDAYLEPWGRELVDVFDLAMCVGTVAHACGWARQRQFLAHEARASFDIGYATVLRRAIARMSSAC